MGMRWQKQISSVQHKWLISLMAILLRVTLCRQQVGFEIFRVSKMVDIILLRVIFVTTHCDESSVVLRFWERATTGMFVHFSCGGAGLNLNIIHCQKSLLKILLHINDNSDDDFGEVECHMSNQINWVGCQHDWFSPDILVDLVTNMRYAWDVSVMQRWRDQTTSQFLPNLLCTAIKAVVISDLMSEAISSEVLNNWSVLSSSTAHQFWGPNL